MCGIVGFTGKQKALGVILDGLARLEYRGYDSAGCAILQNGRLKVSKVAGKLATLRKAVHGAPFSGTTGIGHTRWATHGRPTKHNAHPHTCCERRIAVVQNGIIENHVALRDQLIREGHTFKSDTDTEVIVHLIEAAYKGDLTAAVRAAVKKLEGSYAIAAVSADEPGKIVGLRIDNPLVIGVGDGGNYFASDVPAILPYTRKIIYLDNREIATITDTDIHVLGTNGKRAKKDVVRIQWDIESAAKSGYPHFMLKEIYEQPAAIKHTLAGRVSKSKDTFIFPGLGISMAQLKRIDRVVFISCGTAWHAGLVGKYAMEELAGLPTDVVMSSEFRYGDPVLTDRTLVIAVSQSGETIDTLMGIKEAKARGARVLSICNVVGSSITRESDAVLYTHAGPEIGVASTKAYTTQLTAIFMLAIALGRLRAVLKPTRAKQLVAQLRQIPARLEAVVKNDKAIQRCAKAYSDVRNFLYIGRRYNFPTAYEGALKLKEISYIHAEGYGAGEMKHGPIALVDGTFPAVAIAVQGRVYEKMISNIQEIKARSGTIIAIATEGDTQIRDHADTIIYVPKTEEIFSAILTVVPLQLLAYHIAVIRGCDVDQPRNLAKSVTVE